MITVHGRATSSNVQLVMWAIGELGLVHEREDRGGPFGGLETDEFTALNPNKLIPVLTDGGLVLWESAAILRYLAAQYGDAHFWPPDPARRAEIDKWAEWAKITFAPEMVRLFLQMVRTPAAERDHAVVEMAAARLANHAAVLDGELRGRVYLGGEHLSFADIALGHVLYRYMTLDFDREDAPALAAYYERLTERPAFRAHVMIDWQGMKVAGA